MSIYHINERQTTTKLAIHASILRLMFRRKNTDLLQPINMLDPFHQ